MPLAGKTNKQKKKIPNKQTELKEIQLENA